MENFRIESHKYGVSVIHQIKLAAIIRSHTLPLDLANG
jgi:hypothetical protein